MAINDLLGSLKRGVVRAGLGLALLGPTYATGCGDTIINNNYGSTDVEENEENNTCNLNLETACDCYDKACPNNEFDLSNCVCTEEVTFDLEKGDDCLFIYCLSKIGFCIDPNNPDTTQGESETLNCMESYGYMQCDGEFNICGDNKTCINNRCI